MFTGTDARDDGRGVSDVLGFVFVFTIIVTSVGVVSTMGFDMLHSVQTDERERNAVRAFQALDRNFEDMTNGHAPGRRATIDAQEGSIRLETGMKLAMYLPGMGFHDYKSANTIVYDVHDSETEVGYEMGAVFRRDQDGQTVMVTEPQLACVPGEHYIVTIVKLTSDANTLGGDGTIQIRGRDNESSLEGYAKSPPGHYMVSMNIYERQTRYYDAWRRYFERHPGWVVHPRPGNPYFNVQCPNDADGGQGMLYQNVIDVQLLT